MKLNLERFLPILLKFLPIFIRLLPIFVRLFPLFERFVPVFVSYILERELSALKTKESIEDYRTRTVRTGKCYYRIDTKTRFTAEQTKIILDELVTKY